VSKAVLSVIDATSGTRTGIILTSNTRANDTALAWSRDGTRIAVGDAAGIVVVRLSDRIERILPVADGRITSLVWTENDSGIAYLEDGLVTNTNPAARLVDLSSGTGTALDLPAADRSLTTDASSLIASPDGSRLVWIENDRRCDVNGCDGNFPQRFAMLDRSGIHPFDPGTAGCGSWQWSPAGDELLCSSGNGLVVTTTAGPPRTVGTGLNLEWSADEVTWQPLFN
jgi:hypothetical protein